MNGAARMGEKTAARITGTACERAKMYRRLPSLLCRRFPNRRGVDLSEIIDTTHGPPAEALRHSGLGSPRYVARCSRSAAVSAVHGVRTSVGALFSLHQWFTEWGTQNWDCIASPDRRRRGPPRRRRSAYGIVPAPFVARRRPRANHPNAQPTHARPERPRPAWKRGSRYSSTTRLFPAGTGTAWKAWLARCTGTAWSFTVARQLG